MGMVLPVLMLVYYWKAVGNVRYVRRRLGLDDGIGPRAFVGVHVASRVLLLVVVLAAVVASGADLADPVVVAGATVAGVLVSYGILAYGYRELQGDVNEVWGAWEERQEELRARDRGAGDPTDRPPEAGSGGPWGRTGSRG